MISLSIGLLFGKAVIVPIYPLTRFKVSFFSRDKVLLFLNPPFKRINALSTNCIATIAKMSNCSEKERVMKLHDRGQQITLLQPFKNQMEINFQAKL